MSFRAKETFVITAEAPLTCEHCGNVSETRPYGPSGQRICFTCAELPRLREIVRVNFCRAMDGLLPIGAKSRHRHGME